MNHPLAIYHFLYLFLFLFDVCGRQLSLLLPRFFRIRRSLSPCNELCNSIHNLLPPRADNLIVTYIPDVILCDRWTNHIQSMVACKEA